MKTAIGEVVADQAEELQAPPWGGRAEEGDVCRLSTAATTN